MHFLSNHQFLHWLYAQFNGSGNIKTCGRGDKSRSFEECFLKFSQPLSSAEPPRCRQRLSWTKAVEEAFQNLKMCFTSAPLLQHPSPSPLSLV